MKKILNLLLAVIISTTCFAADMGIVNSSNATKIQSADGTKAVEVSNSGASITLGSDATGDIFYRNGSGYLTRLASVANAHFMMNAAGNAPEEVTGTSMYYVGYNTHDISSTASQVITGVGFKPSCVLFIAELDDASNSFGFCDASTNRSIYLIQAGNNTGTAAGSCIYIYQTNGINPSYASLASFDASGFTLTWGKSGSPTGTLNYSYIAFR